MRLYRFVCSLVAASLLLLGSASAAEVRYPLTPHGSIWGLVFTPDGTAWESSTAGIRRLEPDGGATQIVAGGYPVTPPVVGPDGAVWVAIGDEVLRIDPDTNAVTRFAQPSSVYGLTVGPDDLLWIVLFQTLVRMNTSGQIVSTSPLAAPLRRPFADTFLPIVTAGGAVWAIAGDGTGVFRIDASGAVQSFPVPVLSAVTWIATGGDALWLANEALNGAPQVIVRLGFNGDVLGRFVAPVSYIFGFAADSAGNLWFTDELTDRVWQMTPEGNAVVVATVRMPDVLCLRYGPEPIAISADGRVAVGKSYASSPITPVVDPCFTDDAARPTTIIFNPALVNVPTAGTAALILLAAGLAMLGAVRLLR